VIFPCDPCQALYDGWTMYQKPATRWIQYMNVTRSIESRKNQIREHRELINRQCAAIKDSCRRKCEHLQEDS
jgi:hypothetical protein